MTHSFLTRIFSLLFILSFSFNAFSQSAVQVIPSVLPPYSTLLSEYYSGDQNRLSVTLLNTDAAEPFLQGYLRITIEGQGVKLQSVAFGNYPTIDLMTGSPVTLSQSDFAPYFSPQNLQGTGAGNQNRLPEGFYQFCFEVFEKNTRRLIGSKQCAQAYLTLSDPAFLLLPEKAKVISFTNPFNLLFQWTPRHINLINTEYQFDLVEIWDEGIAPEAAFYTGKPIYSTSTNMSNLYYGPAEPQLLMGKKYAWRVKTKVTTSNNEQEPFKNEGYSEVFWFKLQGECPSLQTANVVADPRTNKTTLSWVSDPVNIGGVKLDYRKKGSSAWKTIAAESNQVSLTGLAWSTDYEYQLGNRCVITDDFAYGNVQSFRTLNQDTSNCVPAPAQPLSNQEPLASLKVGDVIFVADFSMRLTSVSGANGSFSGEGAIGLLIPTTTTVVGVKAFFTNISVNTDYHVFAGKIISKYDATESNVGNLDAITKGGGGVGDALTGTTTAINVIGTIDPSVTAIVETTITGPGDTTYTVTMKGIDGKAIVVTTKKLPAVVQDSTGKIYGIDKDGKITPLGQSSVNLLAGKGVAELNTLSLEIGKVTFEAHPDQVYAFDPYQDTYGNSSYFDQEYENLNSSAYRVGNKLLVENSIDKIYATISGAATGVDENNIHFITAKGVEFAATKNGSTYEINLLSGPPSDAQELYALYIDEEKIIADPSKKAEYTYSLGKLKIATYEKKELSVTLVKVGNAQVDKEQISARLNKIYNPVGINWTVNVAEESFPFSDDWNLDKDQKLNITGAGKYNQYSDEMKLLNASYLATGKVTPGIPYLFVFANAPKSGQEEEGKAVMGDMLRNKQFGYLFLQGNNDQGQVMGHELAHGVFHLQHTFDTEYYLHQGDLRNNLMDYSGGDQLAKLQWDAIHNPGLVIGVFEGEGDSQFYKQLAECLIGAGLDFTFYYTSIWVTILMDDDIPDNLKPGFTDFTAVTSYKEFSWTEALVSAGITCAASTLPSFIAPETSRLMIIGGAALGGAVTGFSTEIGKQYDLASIRVRKTKPNPSIGEVFSEIEWKPIIVNTASVAVITGGATWLATSPKCVILVNRIKSKLSINDLNTQRQKLVDYLSSRMVKKVGVVGKIGDNLINSVVGDIRKFSEYALVNPSKTGLFIDSWGYKLVDADNLLSIYKNQAIQAIKEGKAIFNKTTQYGDEYKIITILNTPNKGKVTIYSGWIVKNEKLDELILSTPYDGFVK